MSCMNPEKLLCIKNLRTYFRGEKGVAKAVDNVSLDVDKGKTVGLIGETGSGKTTVAFSVLGLIPHLFRTETGILDPARHTIYGKFIKTPRRVVSEGELVDGEILFKEQDLLRLSKEEMRQIRGKEIAMIFQNPVASMHPMKIIGYQTGEPKEVHERARWRRIRDVVFDYLGKVELKEPRRRYYDDPHRFSGGEGQRIMIAMALICNPSLLIADEPTSSMDVLVKRQVLELLKKMKEEFKLTMLLITHELGVIAEMSDYVGVMYAGKLLEFGDVFTVFKNPRHPYTKGLLSSALRMDRKAKIYGIPGSPPDPFNLPEGCRFHPRCKHSREVCSRRDPEPIEAERGHTVACLRLENI